MTNGRLRRHPPLSSGDDAPDLTGPVYFSSATPTASILDRAPPVRRSAVLAALSLPWAVYALSTLSAYSADVRSPGGRSRISRSLAVYQSCSVSALTKPDRPVVPVYGASYPGSGSRTLHYLSEALTGLEAGVDAVHRGDKYDKVLIRTHYPAWKKEVEGSRLMDRAVLWIRDPLDALPNHAALYYERNRKKRASAAATVEGGIFDGEEMTDEFWTEWRDDHFDEEMEKWGEHLSHWASKGPKEKRLVVSYEHLTDGKRGAVETSRIAAFLGRGDGVDAVPTERVPCVWDKVVNYGSKSVERRTKEDEKDEEGRADYAFTVSQLKRVQRTLEGLKGKFTEEYTLGIILNEYNVHCKRKLKEELEWWEKGEKVKKPQRTSPKLPSPHRQLQKPQQEHHTKQQKASGTKRASHGNSND